LEFKAPFLCHFYKSISGALDFKQQVAARSIHERAGWSPRGP